MAHEFDVIIIGSGPAGVSAAFPLLAKGLRVLMVDGGKSPAESPLDEPYLQRRRQDLTQWRWMIGKDYAGLKNMDASSPKMRIPHYAPVFDAFSRANKLTSENFSYVGSLAQGGLSNVWGCGVAKFSAKDFESFPFSKQEIESSYASIALRMGISGGINDDLSDYFGLDEYADPPIQLDSLQSILLDRYERKRSKILSAGVTLGRSRVAVLSRQQNSRLGCNLSGNCLWGCSRGSIYNASFDLDKLKQYPHFTYRPGQLVERIISERDVLTIQGRENAADSAITVQSNFQIKAKKAILAAGTLASTRLALQTLNFRQPVSIQSSPAAAFMLWLPPAFGTARKSDFGLGQVSFTANLTGQVTGFGSLFNTTGIPISEFAKFMPLTRPNGIKVLRSLLSSCIVGNFYLPSRFTSSTMKINQEGEAEIRGKYQPEVYSLMRDAKKKLTSAFASLGALMLPGSFKVANVGADIHFGGTLPMAIRPSFGQTDKYGQLAGIENLYIADGACLSSLPEKSHTLTIMANADRIGKFLATSMVEPR
jgi:choline dehydrogenase-like flavoprotein